MTVEEALSFLSDEVAKLRTKLQARDLWIERLEAEAKKYATINLDLMAAYADGARKGSRAQIDACAAVGCMRCKELLNAKD